MSPEPESAERKRAAARARLRERRPELTRWKLVLLAVAGLFVVLGGVLAAAGGGAGDGQVDPSTSQSTGGGGPQPNTLVPGAGDPGAAGSDEAEVGGGAASWSPFFLKGGFSFFVAFCVGYAVRVWLKIATIFLGTFFLGVFLLSWLGALDPDWVTLEGWWDSFTAWVGREAADFQTFLTGSLPQAGLASLGLVTGFKKR